MFALPISRIIPRGFRSRPIRPTFRTRPPRSYLQVRHKVSWTETIHVRFQELPQFRRRMFEAFVYITAFYVFQRVVFGPLEDLDLPTEEDVKGYRKKRKDGKPSPDEVLNGTEEYEGENEPWFIPLGFTTELPKEWYRGGDPEWKEFAKLAKDQRRGRFIQEQLVALVRSQCAADPRVQTLIGKVNTTQGKWWLDTHFPYSPPTTYSRTGVEVGDEAITWTTRTVTDVNHNRLNRALYPLATIQSMYATSAVLTKTAWHDLQSYLGYKPKPDPEIIQVKRLHAHIVAHHLKQRSWGDDSNAVPSSIYTSSSSSSTTASTSTSISPSSDAHNKSKQQNSPLDPTKFGIGIPPSFLANVMLGRVLFLHNLHRNPAWNVNKAPPRGSVIICGSVEVLGSRGRMRVEVEATYDVKEGKYLGVKCSSQRFQPFKQSPRGGA